MSRDTPQVDSDHAERNKQYWDKRGAEAFKGEWVQTLYAQITGKVNRCCAEWLLPSPASVQPKLLDYACGNGAGTRLFRAHFESVVGMDIAPGMVEAFNREYANDAKVRGVAGDISSVDPAEITKLSDSELFGFDMAVIVMALHHVPDPARTIRNLLARVRVGGSVVVIDWIDDGQLFGVEQKGAESEEAKQAIKTVTKHGFTKAELEGYYRAAGCEEESVRVDINEEVSRVPSRRGDPHFFVARGIRKE
ncbi:hypothetical protein KEM54_005289 [Ascosphaera aggregata]|nr:hypothetical protein KEM54_005289 [Ascosphaera aggregata]